MLKWTLALALLFAFCTCVHSQYPYCEADWFAFRIKFADQFETIKPQNDRVAVVWRNGRCGIADRDGKVLVPLQYQVQSSYKPILRDEQRFAVVREDGSVWEISAYDDVQPFSENLWQVTIDGATGLMDSAQRWILPPRFVEISGDSKRLYASDTSGKWGEIDLSGRWLGPPGVFQFSNGLFFRRNKDWRYMLTDSAGTPISDRQYGNVAPMCDGSYWGSYWDPYRSNLLSYGNSFYHYDKNGNLLPDTACQRIIGFGGDVLKVLRKGQYVLWDSCGNILIPGASWEYEEENSRAYEFPDHEPWIPYDMVRFQKDKLFGVYLGGNKKIIPPQYRRIYAAPGKIIAGRTSGGTDWYDRAGNLLKTTPDSITGLPDPSWRLFFITGKDGLQGVIDADGNLVIPMRYKNLQIAGSGCYSFRNNDGQKKLLNPAGVEIPMPAGYQFDRVCGNYVLFKRLTTGGLTDLSGRVVVEPQYEWLYPMHDNYLFQFKGDNDLYGVVDATGRIVLPAEYRQGSMQLEHGYIFLEKNGFYGIADRKGRLIHPFEYTGKNWLGRNTVLTKQGETFVFHPNSGTLVPAGVEWGGSVINGYIAARRNGRWGLVNSKLEQVLPFDYDTIYEKEYHLVARRKGQEEWYKEDKGKLKAVEVDRILESHYWATVFERGGKKGLVYRLGDTIPALYDQIALDYQRKTVMALLNDGICTVPAEKGKPPRFAFPADSLRSFYIDDWLQYWHKGEAWMLNVANGAKRRMELLMKNGEESRYEIFDIGSATAIPLEPAIIYHVRINDRERYVLLDNMLQDRVPDSLDIEPQKYIHRPDGNLMLRIVRNGREGLWDVGGRSWVFPSVYDAVEKVEQLTDRHVRHGGLSSVVRYPAGVVLLRKNGLYGLGRITDGTILLPCTYDGIEAAITKDSFLQITKGEKFGLYRPSDGKMLSPIFENWLEVQHDGLIPLYLRGDSSGYADAKLDIIVPPIYQSTERTGQYIATKNDSLWGFYDLKGNLVQPCQYRWLGKIEGSGKLIVDKQGKYALLDEDLQPLTGFDWDFIDQQLLPNGWLEYGVDKWDSILNCDISWHGLIDTFGKVVLKPEFRDLFFCNNRLVLADGVLRKYGILQPDLRTLVPYIYDRVQCTRDSAFIVRINDKTGILNRQGTVLVASEYDNIEQGDGRNTPYIVGKNERYALMDRSGRPITGFEYDYADGFRAGRAAVRRDGRWGYVDSTGRVVIPLQYAFADRFSDKGLAWVLLDDRLIRIDTLGRIVPTEPTVSIDHERSYSWTWNSPKAGLKDDFGRTVFRNDSLAIVPPHGPVCMYEAMQRDSGARWGLMDLTGRILTPRIFDSVDKSYFDHYEIVPVKRSGKWGYINRRGTLVIPFRFDKANPFDREGRAKVEQNGKSFVIDKSGKCVEGCE